MPFVQCLSSFSIRIHSIHLLILHNIAANGPALLRLHPLGVVLLHIGDAVRGNLANEVFGERLVVGDLHGALPGLVLCKFLGKALYGGRSGPEADVRLVRRKAEQNSSLPEHRDPPLDRLRPVGSDTL
jgi:hypothetical protein